MEPIKRFGGSMVALPINDIDTDQIIPARYLKVTDKAGLGAAAFSDWRYNADGTPKAQSAAISGGEGADCRPQFRLRVVA
jgi:3-isopropylmalate dehydratase small subunit